MIDCWSQEEGRHGVDKGKGWLDRIREAERTRQGGVVESVLKLEAHWPWYPCGRPFFQIRGELGKRSKI